ncbi:hypothetical protein V2J09_018057 [Rumex salicifolius]
MDYDNQWRDPLLLTDVSTQQQQPRNSSSSLSCVSSVSKNSLSPAMSDGVGGSLNQPRGKSISAVRFTDPVERDIYNGHSTWGSYPISPDLVVFSDSPLTPKPSYEDSPECLKSEFREEMRTSIVLSLEEGIDGFETKTFRETTNNSTISNNWNILNEDVASDVSFELVPLPIELVECEEPFPVISINAGGDAIEADETVFLQDNSFDSGDVIRTVNIGNGGSVSLYQTARLGNFSYKFSSLKPGKYIVDLHFAEIVFTEGPPGMRVFDVYIQEEKAISSLDIYARVGANKPLVLSGLEASVKQNGLSIRFQGLIGNPIVSGISIRKDHLRSSEEIELTKLMGMLKLTDGDMTEVNHGCVEDRDLKIMQRQSMTELKELEEAWKVIEELKRENQVKTKKCQEALKSLQELQNELMRKSMHVGSLAFAIEGQVKEKSKWFSVLRDLQRRLKILKVEYINLSNEARKYKKCIADMDEMKCSIVSTIREQVSLNKQLELKFLEGEKERKDLYNKVLELKGNIRVFCRCRPLNVDEIARGASMVIDFESARDGELTVKTSACPKKTFKFDSVLGPQVDQADVFEDTAAFASSVLDGYNVCIFAYGQTGTGKTFTMEGTKEARGVNYRTLEKLFHIIGERQKLFRYELSVSVLEVYNEQIRDLLSPGSQSAMSSKRLEVRQISEGIHHIPGLTEAHINNLSEVWDVLQTGTNARAVSATNANEHSSSERIAKTEAQGDQLREAKNINRSLSALGDVISALATKSSHVPFRNSKLTHLLQDSLGGESKTLMFVHISPNENDLSETLCSLNFASRVKGIELGPAKKQFDSTEVLKHKQMVEKTKQDVRSKDVQLKRMEETIYNLEVKVKERDLKNKNLQDKVKELESQLLIERKLARQHVDTKLAEQYNPLARPPLMDKPLSVLENINDHSTNRENFINNRDSMEKENNPEIAEKLLLPKRTIGRSSLCPTARRVSIASAAAPRRNSLIPLPSSMVQTVSFNPLPASRESIEECSPGRDENESKCKVKSGGKTFSSALRRSLHKRMMKSPLQQQLRKGGVSVGMEKVRVSIGSRGKITQKAVRGSSRKVAAMKEVLPQKVKERGWNI